MASRAVPEKTLPQLAGMVLEAATAADRAAGTALEALALSVLNAALDVSGVLADGLAASATGELAVAAALLASAVVQARAAVASRRDWSAVIASACDCAREEEAGATFPQARHAPARRAPRHPGTVPLRVVRSA